MRNFLIALSGFIIWSLSCLFVLYKYCAFNPENQIAEVHALNPGPISSLLVRDSVSSQSKDSIILYDKSLLSYEMRNTFKTLKLEDNLKFNKNIVYPRWKNGVLINDNEIQGFSKELENKINHSNNLKIRLIGHAATKNSHFKNYARALKISKKFKFFLMKEFDIPKNYISVISEGDSNLIFQTILRKDEKKDKCIEVIFY